MADSIYALGESPIEVIFSSPTVPSPSNPSQSSTSAMQENPNAGVAMQEGLNMATRLLRDLLPLMERQLLMEQDPQMIDALGLFIRISNLHVLFIL